MTKEEKQTKKLAKKEAKSEKKEAKAEKANAKYKAKAEKKHAKAYASFVKDTEKKNAKLQAKAQKDGKEFVPIAIPNVDEYKSSLYVCGTHFCLCDFTVNPNFSHNQPFTFHIYDGR